MQQPVQPPDFNVPTSADAARYPERPGFQIKCARTFANNGRSFYQDIDKGTFDCWCKEYVDDLALGLPHPGKPHLRRHIQQKSAAKKERQFGGKMTTTFTERQNVPQTKTNSQTNIEMVLEMRSSNTLILSEMKSMRKDLNDLVSENKEIKEAILLLCEENRKVKTALSQVVNGYFDIYDVICKEKGVIPSTPDPDAVEAEMQAEPVIEIKK